jgi:hypothetical protein
MTDQVHCPTCICYRRAPVQADPRHGMGPGTISWAEHVEAWAAYASKHGTSQSATRIAERQGFSYGEVVTFLGRDPMTWRAG